ncbi:MAG: DnaJ domain-containing protein [Anaerolineae bacterium]
MARNYYLILGIGADATEDEIKSAYRREAKRLHPDCSGEDCEPFLALHEAYEVLGDPDRRRAYDRELARERRQSQRPAPDAAPGPVRRRRPPVEPLVPGHDFGPSASRRAGGRGLDGRDFGRVSPWASLVDEFFGPRQRRPAPRELHLEVSLTRRQALRGGRLRVWVPAPVRCPVCGGRGHSGVFACQQCHGRGAVVDDVPVDVAFPGGLADGAQGTLPLGRPGMAHLVLVLHFRIEDEV